MDEPTPIGYLTQHFRVDEFLNSVKSGLITANDIIKAGRLASILEDVRTAIACPIIITSGKRSLSHNRAVGGVKSSEHLYFGESAACDFKPRDPAQAEAAYLWLAGGVRERFGQLIGYLDAAGALRWLHLSLPARHKGECLLSRAEPPRKYAPFESKIIRP